MKLDSRTYERWDAIRTLLERPDPSDLPPRSSRQTYPGSPRRRSEIFLPLVVRWAQRRYLENDRPTYIAPARTSGRRAQVHQVKP